MPLSVRTPSTSSPTSFRRRATAASSMVTSGRGQGARLSLGPRQPPCRPPGTSLQPCPLPALHATRPTQPSRFRSEEHTSELQSHSDLVCRLLLEKKKKKKYYTQTSHLKINVKPTLN